MGNLKSYGKFKREEPDLADLYLLEVPSIASVKAPLGLPSSRFVCVLVLNALRIPHGDLSRLAQVLLSQGGVYFCVFGPDCERVHDLIDEELRASRIEGDDDDRVILTTWHSHDTLEDALWYFLFTAAPSPAYVENCGSWLLVSVTGHGNEATLKRVCADPMQFHDEALDAVPDD